MDHLRILPGYVITEITSADIPRLLNELANHGILLSDIEHRSELAVRATINKLHYRQLKVIAQKQGAEIKKVRVFGMAVIANRIVRRPVLMLFLATLLFLTCFLPGRILFVSVEGNSEIPDRFILEAAAQCGIEFGAKRRSVRSEMLKNQLLELIPQLQWAGINTTGCTAIISVREKTEAAQLNTNKYQVSSIVAARDGIIQSCTVQQGNALCSVGQAVKLGQVLVSGYLDCGLVTKATKADAEIRALTFRNLQVISPCVTAVKGNVETTTTRYSFRIGKKLIKFYKDSGNLDTTCGKIYVESSVCLPGGFCLPITIIRESVILYGAEERGLSASHSGEWLREFTAGYLEGLMISGEIVSADAEVTTGDGAIALEGDYLCLEMIGQVKYEEYAPKDDE